MAELQCLIYAEDGAVREQIRHQLDATAHVDVCGEAAEPGALRELIEGRNVDLLLVGLGSECESVFHTVESLISRMLEHGRTWDQATCVNEITDVVTRYLGI